jgi:dTDP-3-amino-2,3,6-trideoxy-4-keto-D-glucose/dTDP-3-amino-3,4,6-trideoxy-alpha-D-glucose/dTDP-2,6-dideoxy-D-kanosamine transaminase
VRVPFGDLGRQTESIRPELDAAMDRVLSRGRYLFGDELEQFERAFAAWCGAAHAIGIANGTDAITIALQAVGVGPGDGVIIAANTCVPTVVGIENAGAVRVLVDAEPESRTLDPELVEDVVGPQTCAIVPVHLYGQCADLDTLGRIATEHGLGVVEDCAQTHGAELGGTVHYARAIHRQPAYTGLGEGRSLPVAEGLAAEVVSLRLYPELTDDEVDLVCAALRA